MRNTITNNGWNTTEWGLGFLRVSSFPLDPSCTFETEEELQNYLAGNDTDKPYLGQLLAVKTDKYRAYIVQEYDGTSWIAEPLNDDELAKKLSEQLLELKEKIDVELENLESSLKGQSLTSDYDSLSKIQDIIIKHKVAADQAIKNFQKELDNTQVGVGLSQDGSFSPDQETHYLKSATSVMNALKTLDGFIHKVNHLYEDTDSVHLNPLVDEDAHTTTISADVKIAENSDITINSDGLYHRVESEYENGILTLKVNGEVRSEHNIGLDALVEDSYYDPTIESLVIIFKLHDGTTQRAEIPAEKLITELEFENEDPAITLTRERVVDGADKISAEINISEEEKNIIVKKSDGLYAEADFTEVNEKIDDLEDNKVDKEEGKGLSTNDYTNNDKDRLNAIYTGDKTLVSPVISSQWAIKNQNNDSVTLSGVSLTSNSITIETGYKVDYSGSFKWTHNDAYKDPTGVKEEPTVSNRLYGTILPTNGVNSDTVTKSDITTNSTFKVTLTAPKMGLMVSGTKVLPASGNDEASASASVTFQGRRYYGITTNSSPKTAADLSSLGNTNLTSSRTLSVSNVTTNTSQYYCYAYPKSLGALTAIIQNGAQPIIDAFNRTEISIVNNAGLSIDYYVYTSKNVGAFTNATIEFK